MAKSCAMCGKSLGFFANYAELQDGFMCEKCLKQGGLNYYDTFDVGTHVLIDKIRTYVEMKKHFHPTKDCGEIELDMKSHIFKLEGNLYPFSALISYSYREDPENQRVTQHDGKAGGAAVGALVGGLGGGFIGRAIGATVGATIGGKVGGLFSSVCNYMYIKVTLDDEMNPEEKLSFISEKTRVSSEEYREALSEARDCIEALDIILRHNEAQKNVEASQLQHKRALAESQKSVYIQNGHMSAENINRELTTYKTMMASGLITEEEYNAKKKQLLSLM